MLVLKHTKNIKFELFFYLRFYAVFGEFSHIFTYLTKIIDRKRKIAIHSDREMYFRSKNLSFKSLR